MDATQITIQERILQYLEYKGITPYKFCKDLGFAQGYLDKRGNIGLDKYVKIIKFYPDLGERWLMTGKGYMIKDPPRQTFEQKFSNILAKYSHLTDNSQPIPEFSQLIPNEAKDEIIELLKKQIIEKNQTIQSKDFQLQQKDERINALTDELIKIMKQTNNL